MGKSKMGWKVLMDRIGLHIEGPVLKLVKINSIKNTIKIDLMRSFPIIENGQPVKPLYFSKTPQNEQAHLLISGLEAHEILVRHLQVKLIDRKKILHSLPFQAEEHIPFPPEETLLFADIQTNKASLSSNVLLYGTKKSYLQQHLKQFKEIGIEPEHVSCIPAALWRYASFFFPSLQNAFLFHFGSQNSVALCILDGKLAFSFAFPVGIELLIQALVQDCNLTSSQEEILQKAGELDLLDIQIDTHPHLYEAFCRTQKELFRILDFMKKKLGKAKVQDVILAGNFSQFAKFKEMLFPILGSDFSLHSCPSYEQYDSTTLEAFAVPIGLALEGHFQDERSVQFRQNDFLSSTSYKRKIKALVSYTAAILTLTTISLCTGFVYLHKKEHTLLQTCQKYFSNEIPNTEWNSLDKLSSDLDALGGTLRKEKIPFPLALSIPNVSEVLAWISTHPSLNPTYTESELPPIVDVHHIKYTLVKYPKIGSPMGGYQAKVEMELECSNSHIAKEFHQSLLKESSLADAKKEISWHVKGSLYTIGFFLKSKQGMQQ